MISRRLLLHVLFWLCYFIISLYNELYLSPSFSKHPTVTLFIQSTVSVLLVLSIKMAVVYFMLYKLLPLWVAEKRAIIVLGGVFGSLLVGVLLMRFMMHLVIWPHVYNEIPGSISAQGQVARFFYSLFDLLEICGIAVCIKLYKLRMELLKKERLLLIERSRAELWHLKSQINPHFLFNTLNSIYSLSREASEKTPDSIMRLSKLMRYTLYDSAKKMIPIEEEIRIIKDYTALQQLRFGNRIRLKLDIDKPYIKGQITPLLLLPLIENAYKHCREENSDIEFNLRLDSSVLLVSASNPSEAAEMNKNGTGLGNLKRQLELLYRDFKLDYFLKEGVFHLKLMINLDSYVGDELFDTGR